MMEERKTGVNYIIITGIIIVIFFIFIYIKINMNTPLQYKSCEYKEYILQSQVIGYNEQCVNDRCLIINVQNLNSHEERYIVFGAEIKLLNETELNINTGDEIKIRWCTDIKDRQLVKGITKK